LVPSGTAQAAEGTLGDILRFARRYFQSVPGTKLPVERLMFWFPTAATLRRDQRLSRQSIMALGRASL
jgi:hypothetical protein